MADFSRTDEQRNGVRLPWNVMPVGMEVPDLFPIPLASMYSPFASLDEVAVLEYSPVECSGCGAVLNPHAVINHHKKSWRCPMCRGDNNLPYAYHGITEYNLPPELGQANSTVEYVPSREAITAKVIPSLRSKGKPETQLPPSTPGAQPTPQSQMQSSPPHRHPVLIFILDTCLITEELSALKATLNHAISNLPEETYIGLITYGKNVEVHDLFSERFSKSYAFQGMNSQADIRRDFQRVIKSTSITHMICPLNECLMHITSILQTLESDPWEYDVISQRPLRSTGTALHIASLMYRALLSYDNGRFNTRIMLFTGGVCTIGDGATADISLSKPFRAHIDIARNQLSQKYKESKEYYYKLALQVLADTQSVPYASCTFDIFACALDQVGLAEMSSLVQLTNGNIVLDDSFSHGVFRGSVKNILSPVTDQFTDLPVLPMAFAGQLSIYTSKHLQIQYQQPLLSTLSKTSGGGGATSKIASFLTSSSATSTGPTTGALDPDEALSLAGKLASSNVVAKLGAGNKKDPYYYLPYLNHGAGFYPQNAPINKQQQHWSLPAIAPSSTITTIFTPSTSVPQESQDHGGNPQQPNCYIQYKTRYIDGLGREVIRVTTISRTCMVITSQNKAQSIPQLIPALRSSFDQDSAMALLTRIAVAKSHSTYSEDVHRWVDHVLIQFGMKYANFLTGNSESFAFSPQFSMLPQYVFYLRRSQLLRVFNSSPDETAFFRLVSQTETTPHILLMIQPQLIAYGINTQPSLVPLDTTSLDSKKILVLDTYFHIVLWYGQLIAQWKEQGLHLQPEYSYLGDLMKAPLRQAKVCLESRLPTPRFIECIERGSQSRFLTAKLSNSTSAGDTQGGVGGTNSAQQQQQYNQFAQYAAADGFMDENLPAMFSEDLSLRDFINEFKNKVVAQSASARK